MKSCLSCFYAGLLALFILILGLPVVAQTPSWQSARALAAATTTAWDNGSYVSATAVDAAGNVYLTGYFANTVTFGNTTLTSFGKEDVFIAKFSPASNQFVWVRQAGGTGSDFANALVVSGNEVYAAGYFYSATVSFGSTTLLNAGAPAYGSDVFVAKLTDAGNYTWVQRAGGANQDVANALAVRGADVYVAGSYIGATTFGPATLSNPGAPFTSDVYVAKLSDAGSAGTFIWAQRAGGSDIDEALALAVSGSSVYVAGNFNSATASFGATTLTNAGVGDMYVAKLTDAGSSGSFVWAQRAGGTRGDGARALAVSGQNVYVAGSFSSATADFGATTLTSISSSDMFVAKLTDAGSTGSFAWVQQGSAEPYGIIGAAALAIQGASVCVAGAYTLSVHLGSSTLTSVGSNDIFVAKLTDAGSTGSFAWAQQAGGPYSDVARALTLDGSTVYVAGTFFSPTVSFGPVTTTNPFPNFNCGFLASLTDATTTAAASSRFRAPSALYPNPARHTVVLRRPAGSAPAPLTLCDALGRPVRRYPAPAAAEATLDLRGLPAGLYLLRGAGPAQRLVVE